MAILVGVLGDARPPRMERPVRPPDPPPDRAWSSRTSSSCSTVAVGRGRRPPTCSIGAAGPGRGRLARRPGRHGSGGARPRRGRGRLHHGLGPARARRGARPSSTARRAASWSSRWPSRARPRTSARSSSVAGSAGRRSRRASRRTRRAPALIGNVLGRRRRSRPVRAGAASRRSAAPFAASCSSRSWPSGPCGATSWSRRSSARRGSRTPGSWLPGFGGILDRIDSLLVTVALAYWAVRLWGTASERRTRGRSRQFTGGDPGPRGHGAPGRPAAELAPPRPRDRRLRAPRASSMSRSSSARRTRATSTSRRCVWRSARGTGVGWPRRSRPTTSRPAGGAGSSRPGSAHSPSTAAGAAAPSPSRPPRRFSPMAGACSSSRKAPAAGPGRSGRSDPGSDCWRSRTGRPVLPVRIVGDRTRVLPPGSPTAAPRSGRGPVRAGAARPARRGSPSLHGPPRGRGARL